jgi:riboflavin biosynthesis pyrimidine reductase
MVEGGAAVLRSILESGLWDEAHIEVAPELTLQEPGVPAPDLLQQAKEHPGTIRITQETVDGHCLYTLQK